MASQAGRMPAGLCLLLLLCLGAAEGRHLQQATVSTATPVGVNAGEPSVEALSGLGKLHALKRPVINFPEKVVIEKPAPASVPQVAPTQQQPQPQQQPEAQPITLVMPQQQASEAVPTTTTGGISIHTSTPVTLSTPINVKTPVVQKNFQLAKGLPSGGCSSGCSGGGSGLHGGLIDTLLSLVTGVLGGLAPLPGGPLGGP